MDCREFRNVQMLLNTLMERASTDKLEHTFSSTNQKAGRPTNWHRCPCVNGTLVTFVEMSKRYDAFIKKMTV